MPTAVSPPKAGPSPSLAPDASYRRQRELEERVRRLEEELEAIHRSKMWRLWMAYLAARRAASAPLRFFAPGGRGGVSRAAAGRAVARYVKRALGWGPRALVWLGLLGGTALELSRAALRRRLGTVEPVPPVAPMPAAPPRRRPRVLIVSPYSVYPPDHGGGVRLSNLIRGLAEHCEVYALVFIRAAEDGEQRRLLERHCARVVFHHWQPSFDPPLWSALPPSARLFASERALRRIEDLVVTHGVDVLQLEYTELGQYGLPEWIRRRVGVVLTEHDVAFRSHRRRRGLGFHKRFPDSRAFGASFGDWMRQLRYELEVCRAADQLHMMSHEDGAYLAPYLADGGRRMRVIPNAVDTAFYREPEPPRQRRGVLYVGNYQNLPNVDALTYLVGEIWPRLRRRLPDLTLTAVGAHPPPEILALDGRHGVTVAGSVPDLRPWYHGHAVLAAPIRAGSGTRLKLFEAFAAGIPVVSTTLGAEGIGYRDGEHLLLADDPESFAAALARVLEDGELARSLATAARRLAEERYDWRVSVEASVAAYAELMARPGEEEEPAPEVPPGWEEAGEAVEVSVILPTFRGGEKLAECLRAIFGQRTERAFEVICVDSGSPPEDLAMMEEHGARLHRIPNRRFNHGLTRDLGARLAGGEVLVFLNQDAVPANDEWLEGLTAPLFEGGEEVAAVQGGILEVPRHEERFYWDSCGHRFYFTRESARWMHNYQGLGFSTVNAAIRRAVWERIPFGYAPIMEDKKWQREAVEAGYTLLHVPTAAVLHTHDYDLRSLARRCQSEGFGWRVLGEHYTFGDMLADMARPRVYVDLVRGVLRGRLTSAAEILFPLLRPFMLYRGNRWNRGVKL